jgi:hypothetical protein
MLGRIANGVVAFGFLMIAAWALWSPEDPGFSLLGLLIVLTPTIVFLTASLSPSALEVASSVSWFAVIMRLMRGGNVSRWLWVGLGLSGAALGSARSLGPLWVLLGVALLFATGGVRSTVALVRRNRGWAGAAASAVAVGTIAGGIWELAVQPHPPHGRVTGAFLAAIGGQGLAMFREAIGVFGYLDTRLPSLGYVTWELLILVVVVLAVLVAPKRERIVIFGSLAAIVGVTFALGYVYLQTGFTLQSRFVLPVAVAVPMYCVEVIARCRHRLGPISLSRLPGCMVILVALVQGVAWYTNARRYAVGTSGPILFVGRSKWSPAPGWGFWSSIALLASGCLFLAGAILMTSRDSLPVEIESGRNAASRSRGVRVVAAHS